MKKTEWNEFIKTSNQVNFLRWVVETYGYSLEAAYVERNWEPRIYINKDYEKRFLPRLYLDYERDENLKPINFYWKIETVSYGSLSVEEYQELMENMKNWLDCCKFLNQFNYDMLPKVPEQFDEE